MVLLALVVLLVASLTTIGIVTHKSEDRAWLKRNCGGQMVDLNWQPQAFPLRVHLGDTLDQEWREGMQGAMVEWNQAVGLALFREVSSSQAEDVAVTHANITSHGRATLRWGAACRLRQVSVTVPGLVSGSVVRKVAMHELGHVLGLDHDTYVWSVMYRTANAMGVANVTNHDKEIIRQWVQHQITK